MLTMYIVALFLSCTISVNKLPRFVTLVEMFHRTSATLSTRSVVTVALRFLVLFGVNWKVLIATPTSMYTAVRVLTWCCRAVRFPRTASDVDRFTTDSKASAASIASCSPISALTSALYSLPNTTFRLLVLSTTASCAAKNTPLMVWFTMFVTLTTVANAPLRSNSTSTSIVAFASNKGTRPSPIASLTIGTRSGMTSASPKSALRSPTNSVTKVRTVQAA
uniref:(northern house mosquito) hypothetical protein n=1 Tax=Culex pipiens TaxID=7175 RepID=A0A8D8NVL8_CULPI